MNTLAIIGILISLGLLMFLAYKGWCVIAIAPLVALVAVVIGAIAYQEPPHMMAHYSEIFMGAVATYVKNYFPVYMLGALFLPLHLKKVRSQAILYDHQQQFLR